MKPPITPRKTDILDTWEQICRERRLAYEDGNQEKVEALNADLMSLRNEGGWTQTEIKEEFEMYDKVLHQPFNNPIGNANIKYDVNDESGKPRGLSLSLTQVSQYWKYRDGGLKQDRKS